MMNRKTLKHIVKGHFSKMENALEIIQETYADEAIHQFRVRTKKLAALLHLLHIKLPGSIKKIYAAAGQIRNIQLELKQICKATASNKVPGAYVALLHKQLKKRKAFFNAVSESKHLSHCRRKLNRKLPPSLPADRIAHYMRNELEALRGLTAAGAGDDYLHGCRKKIKDIIYLHDLFNEQLKRKSGIGIPGEAAYQKLLAIADTLGNVTDSRSAISLLRQHWIEKVNLPEQKQLRALRRQWKDEKKQLCSYAENDLHANISAVL